MKRIWRILALAVAALSIASAVSACSDDNSTPTTYAPAAYGQSVNGVFDCYYVNSPLEVTAPNTGLVARGMCPANAIAYPMPTVWEETYFPYYSSPAYYNVFVPLSYRSSYRVYTINFSKTYSRQISTYSSRGTYKGSNGSTISGSNLSKVGGTSSLKFGSGTSSTTHGGGTRGCAESLTVVHMRGGSSGGSHGGGSRGSTSSGSKTGSSGSKTGSNGSRVGTGC